VQDDAGAEVAAYDTDELRYSVSWKAYCFADETERRLWEAHDDDLRLETILDVLERDLRDRGALVGDRPPDVELAKLLIETYVRFPEPAVAGSPTRDGSSQMP
jgi:hypothetical protein